MHSWSLTPAWLSECPKSRHQLQQHITLSTQNSASLRIFCTVRVRNSRRSGLHGRKHRLQTSNNANTSANRSRTGGGWGQKKKSFAPSCKERNRTCFKFVFHVCSSRRSSKQKIKDTSDRFMKKRNMWRSRFAQMPYKKNGLPDKPTGETLEVSRRWRSCEAVGNWSKRMAHPIHFAHVLASSDRYCVQDCLYA